MICFHFGWNIVDNSTMPASQLKHSQSELRLHPCTPLDSENESALISVVHFRIRSDCLQLSLSLGTCKVLG